MQALTLKEGVHQGRQQVAGHGARHHLLEVPPLGLVHLLQHGLWARVGGGRQREHHGGEKGL